MAHGNPNLHLTYNFIMASLHNTFDQSKSQYFICFCLFWISVSLETILRKYFMVFMYLTFAGSMVLCLTQYTGKTAGARSLCRHKKPGALVF